MITKEQLEQDGFKHFEAKSYKSQWCLGLWQKRIKDSFYINFYIYSWPDGGVSVECEGHFMSERQPVTIILQNPPSIIEAEDFFARFFSSFNCDYLND